MPLAGGGVAVAVVLPKAKITVTPKTAPLNTEIPLNFSTRATATDPAGNVIPAKVVEVIKQTSKQATATGPQTEGGNRATGTITVTNNLRRNQSLVAQTRFQAPDGSIYRIASRLVLPAGGQAKATVTAAAAGEGGNLPAGTALTVPGLGGGGGVTATTAEAFSGGSSGQGTVVSKDDVERAKGELVRPGSQGRRAEARGKLAVGFKIDEQAMVPTVLNANPDPAVGTTAPTFTISGQVRISYFTYEDAEAQRVLKEDLKSKIPAGSDLVEESIQQTFVATQTSADTLGGVIRINTLTAPEISREQIKSDVAGQSPAEAESTLRASGKLENVLVTLSPFWCTRCRTRQKSRGALPDQRHERFTVVHALGRPEPGTVERSCRHAPAAAAAVAMMHHAPGGRILALDVGDVRTGVAVSDELRMTTRALETVATARLASRLPELVSEYGAATVVVGRPRRLDGTLGSQAAKVEVLVAALRQRTAAHFVYEDETGTSKLAGTAKSAGEAAAGHDAVAAAVILSGYLDERSERSDA
ncbi:MAG: Holliday junction resolvase RuvX [Hymenobacter sp.]